MFKVRSVCTGQAHCRADEKSDEQKIELRTRSMAPKRLQLTERYPRLIKIRWSYDGNGTPNEATGIWIIHIGDASNAKRITTVNEKLLNRSIKTFFLIKM